MTGTQSEPNESAGRSATIRSELDDAAILAASVRPDNTPEIDTRVERDGEGVETVVTTVERETTGGLRTTVDDYVVNLTVAQKVVQAGKRHANADTDDKS
ncbi:KEOPS complex subunit Pcc1 [Halorussus caseinilyticus]|uniref:KEOPS complex subunit Pcc1 n=1 Tax=Halorussus caseinilyticus TaxID=3034025 RepID=A0ABD5WK81_9EURY|nr:KEOPS complex subunit Pcc1 [Halorussus sp. DT72]